MGDGCSALLPARCSQQFLYPSGGEALQLHIHNPQDRSVSLGNCSIYLWYINPDSSQGLVQESLQMLLYGAEISFSPILQGRKEPSKHGQEDWLVNGHAKHLKLICLWISVGAQQEICSQAEEWLQIHTESFRPDVQLATQHSSKLGQVAWAFCNQNLKIKSNLEAGDLPASFGIPLQGSGTVTVIFLFLTTRGSFPSYTS